ncbi:major facilitator superfamily domain-containing protein [Rhodocollybia butyracea]|uniref:Major facilitator superfamily domain-containing protein n=1 Tax=Rhodocollybia butyracea TaxID=206335 RepID=A0A9P5Q0B9_9AGAR|nr:major facilitator superfamily domain-containing protein [Rhodocollybia butyracea]
MEKQPSVADDTAFPQSAFTTEKQAYASDSKPFNSTSQQDTFPSEKQPSSSVHDRALESVTDDGSQRTDVIDPDELPEGGLGAWLTVLAVFLLTFVSLGTGSVWGIFQSAYATDPSSRFQQDSTFKIGFVGGCSGLAFIIGSFSNILISKFGIHAPIILGVGTLVAALMLGSIAKTYWELLLSQGIMFGIGCSFAYVPAISLPAQRFQKKRAFATGIASAGACAGAVILAPVVQSSIDHFGIPWALRILGFLTLALGVTAICCIRQRGATKKIVQYRPFDPSLLKIPGYPLYLAFAFLQFFGHEIPLFFIPSYCTTIRISPVNASAVLSVASSVSCIGRIMAGMMADKWGTINVLILFKFLSGLTCLVIWTLAKSLGVMMAFAVFWGFFSGAYWALSVPASAKIVGLEKLGSAVALQFLTNVLPAIFAAPIGSQIIAATAANAGISIDDVEAYKFLIVWAGLASVVSSLILVPVRLGFSTKLLERV